MVAGKYDHWFLMPVKVLNSCEPCKLDVKNIWVFIIVDLSQYCSAGHIKCIACVLDSSVIDYRMLTSARRCRVCYEAAQKPLNVVNATRSWFIRCTDIYHMTGDVSTSVNASEFDCSVAQLCCSVLNSRLSQLNVQPATPLELRLSLHQTTVSIASHTHTRLTALCPGLPG